MRQIGDLWIWVDRSTHRLMLGNAAAMQDAARRPSQDLSTTPPPAERPLPGNSALLGTYALPGGPVVALHTAYGPGLQPEPNPLGMLLAPLKVQAPPDHTFHFSVTASHKRLWRDGALILESPVTPENPAEELSLMHPFQLLLLSDRPVLSLLHGSAIRWRGTTLIFMGSSGSGKSTLAALLVAEGAQYLGDDSVALLHPGGGIRPLPFSPSIKEASWPVVAPHFPALMQMPVLYKGVQPYRYLPSAPFVDSTDAGPADLLVFSSFSTSAPAKMVRLTPVETVLNMSKSGLWMSPDHAEGLIDWTLGIKSVALRQTPDLEQTKEMLLAALNDDMTGDMTGDSPAER